MTVEGIMDWIAIAKDFGVPVAVLAALMSFLWIVAKAIWVGLVIPFRDVLLVRVSAFFDRLDSTLESLTDNVATVSQHMKAQTHLLERIDSQGCAGRLAAFDAAFRERLEQGQRRPEQAHQSSPAPKDNNA